MSDVIADWPRNRILGLLTLGRRHGLDEATMLAGTNTSLAALSGSGHGAGLEDEFVVVRNLLAAVDPHVPLPLEAGLDFHLVAVGSWGEGMRTSPNFGAAVAFGLGIASRVPTVIAMTASVSGPDLMLDFDDVDLPEDVRVFILIRNMVFLSMTARELLGRPLPSRSVTGRAQRPLYAAALDEFCGTTVQWDAGSTRVVIDAALLAEPLAAADPEAHAAAVAECYRMLERHRRREPLGARVLALLSTAGDGSTGLEEVADRLGTSQRSLRRHLSEEGTSFRELSEHVQHERARALLAGDPSLEEIAIQLGYSEAASFSRAFKRWSGSTPAVFRSGLADRTQP